MPGASSREWLHRLLTLRGTSLYWHADAPLHGPAAHDPRVALLGRAVPVNLPQPSREAVVLPPTDASLQARM